MDRKTGPLRYVIGARVGNTIITQENQSQFVFELESKSWYTEGMKNYEDFNDFRCFSSGEKLNNIELKWMVFDFEHTQFDNCHNIYDVDFSKSVFTSGRTDQKFRFHNSNCTKSKFINTIFSRVCCGKTNFTDTNFTGTVFKDVDCTNANFANANFTNAMLHDVDFTDGANLTNIDFSLVSSIKNVKIDHTTIISTEQRRIIENANRGIYQPRTRVTCNPGNNYRGSDGNGADGSGNKGRLRSFSVIEHSTVSTNNPPEYREAIANPPSYHDSEHNDSEQINDKAPPSYEETMAQVNALIAILYAIMAALGMRLVEQNRNVNANIDLTNMTEKQQFQDQQIPVLVN